MKSLIISCCFFLFFVVNAFAQPTSDFFINFDRGCINEEVEFISSAYGGPVEWFWEFGDGATSADINPTHTYANSGTYTITLTVTDAGGLSDSHSENYTVRPPKANFVLNPAINCNTPATVFFTDESSLPDTWSWEFGDGATSTLQNPIHNYTTYGDFTATLTVTDTMFGCTDSFSRPIKVAGVQANFIANGSTFGGFGCGPLTVDFEDTSTVSGNDTIDTWLWDFDDGNTSTVQNPTHVYQDPGIYNVSLTTTLATTGCSNNETKPAFIQVIGPDVDFTTANPTSGCVPLTVNFMDTTIFGAPIISWSWNFGDGTISNLQNPTHTYITEGQFTVALTITDIDGCSRTEIKTDFINTLDTTPPTITCPTTQTEILDAGCTFTIPDYSGLATASDTCGTVAITQVPAPGEVVGAGITGITLTASDGTNTSDCSFNIEVLDISLPNVVCQNITVQLDASGNVTILPSQLDNGSTDNCGVASFMLDINTFNCSDIGDNTVLFTVADVAGNMASCTAVITVEDTVNPVAVCQDITVQLDAFGSASILASEVDGGSADACGIDTMTVAISAFDCTNVGANTVLFTITDVAGNSDSCSAIVTVEDTVAPDVQCQDITIQLDAFGSAAISSANIDAGSSDACGIATMAIDIDTFDCSHLGANNVTLSVTDVNGNINSCIAVVTVEDVEPPVAICQNITVQLDITGIVTILPSQLDNGSIDTCGIASAILDIDTFNCSNVGNNNVVLAITDAGGNTANCTAVVTVEDTVAPVAVCQDITLELDASGQATISAAAIDGGSTDACGIASISINMNTFDCTMLGANNVVLTVIDINANESSCIAIVTVVESNVVPIAICQNITVPLLQDGTATISPQDIDAGSTGEGCFNEISIDIDTFDCTNVGTPVQVILTVTNGNGVTDSCVAFVNVVDSLNPIVECPENQMVISTGPFTVPDYVANGLVVVTDNCTSTAIISQEPTPGTILEQGSYTITINVLDPSNNETSCAFQLTIEDTLGVEPITDLGSVKVYPNPAVHFITIANPQNISLNKVAIYDVSGSIVKQVSQKDIGVEMQIDISELASATYLIIIFSEDGQLVKHLIKE